MIALLGFLDELLRVSTLVFTIGSMLSVGFSYSLLEILTPLRNLRIVLLALIANFLVVPILALLVVRAVPLEPPVALGLFLLACSAGAPFLIKLLDVANGHVGKGATLLVLLTPLTVLFVPFVLAEALAHPAESGLTFGEVSMWLVARPLLLSILAPLATGLLVRRVAPIWAQRLQPALARTASVALVVLVACAVATNVSGIVDLLGFPLLAAGLLTVGAFLAGYVLTIPEYEAQVVVGLGTAQRGVAAAMVVATETIGHPDSISMVVMTMLVGLLLLFPIAGWLRKTKRAPAGAPRPAPEQAPQRARARASALSGPPRRQ